MRHGLLGPGYKSAGQSTGAALRPSSSEARLGCRATRRGDEPTKRARARLSRRYGGAVRDFDKVDQQTRSRAYADAMGRFHERYSDDAEAAIFYALALNEAADLSDTTFTNQLKAVAILEKEAKKQPNHPGIAHYLIHSYDFAPLAALCLPIARHYGELAPAAPHALHMPSHIYSMLGMWDNSITANLAAEAAAREQALTNFPGKDHPGLPHDMDFRIVGYLQMGQDRLAKQVVDQLRGMKPAVSQLPVDTAMQAVPARYAIDRGKWDEAARLEVLPSKYPAAMAIGYFTRGIGAVRSGDLTAAQAELTRLDEIAVQLRATHDEYWARQTDIQRQAVAAWVDFVEGRRDTAITAMNAAANLDDASEKSVSMENRLLPVRTLLGELYLAAGMNVEALAAFEVSLKAQPNRFRSLLGAARAAHGMNANEVTKRYYRALVGLSVAGDGERPELAEAKTYLAAN